MRSLACWTSEPKRASLARRWTSSVSAALSSASETCVASAAGALQRAGATAGRRRRSRAGPCASPRSEQPRTWAYACWEPQAHVLAHLADERISRRPLASELRQAVAAPSVQAPRELRRLGSDDDALAVFGQAQARRRAVSGERARGVERRAIDLRRGWWRPPARRPPR